MLTAAILRSRHLDEDVRRPASWLLIIVSMHGSVIEVSE